MEACALRCEETKRYDGLDVTAYIRATPLGSTPLRDELTTVREREMRGLKEALRLESALAAALARVAELESSLSGFDAISRAQTETTVARAELAATQGRVAELEANRDEIRAALMRMQKQIKTDTRLDEQVLAEVGRDIRALLAAVPAPDAAPRESCSAYFERGQMCPCEAATKEASDAASEHHAALMAVAKRVLNACGYVADSEREAIDEIDLTALVKGGGR